MIDFFSKLFRKKNYNTIYIVSGLPRSGTSMMMKMLDAGGLIPLVDNIRVADEDNPKGYYEFERVKQLENDKKWLPDARGKVVKIISMLLRHLPDDYNYKVVFMLRNVDEILASQRKMLERRGEPTDKVGDEKMALMYQNHLDKLKKQLEQKQNFDTLYVKYNEILNAPEDYCDKINKFLGGILNQQKMLTVIDKNLYRQRKN